MSQTVIYLLILLNLIIITGLGVYIFRKLQHQKQLREENDLKKQAFLEEVQQRRLHIIESLQVIGQSMMNGEIPLTEAGIRCKVLLDNLDPQLAQSEPYSVFNEVFERSKHIPRLEAWKALKGPEKLTFMAEMEALEKELEEDILAAGKALTTQDFNQYH